MKNLLRIILAFAAAASARAQLVNVQKTSGTFLVTNVNSVTSAAGSDLTFGVGTGGTGLTITNSTKAATFSATATVTGSTSLLATTRVSGNTGTPVSGAGIEISYGTLGFIIAYDRSGSVYKDLSIMGFNLTLGGGGGSTVIQNGNSNPLATFFNSGAVTIGLSSATVTFPGNISVSTAGNTISIKSGSNAAAGTFTMVAGSATVTSTAIDANTAIHCSLKTVGGTSGIYTPLTTVGAGSFTATSVATDTSTYNWIAMKVN